MRSRSGLTLGAVVVFATAAWVAGCASPGSEALQIAPAPALGVNDLRVGPSSIGVDVGKSKMVAVKERNYGGKFHSVGSRFPCKGIATWSPHRGNGPRLNVTVNGVAVGNCVFGFTNAIGKTIAWIHVAVRPKPTPSPSPTPPNVKYYSVPPTSAGASEPIAITVGADKNLWFTIFSGTIGRITTSGTFTLFTKGIPVASNLQGIATGTDGNVWFAGKFGVARITTSGAVTKYASSYSNFYAAGIASGPGSALSVAGCDSTNSGCGAYSLTTTGAISFIGKATCGYSPGPFNIAPGPDDSVWYGGSGDPSCVQEFGALYNGTWNVAYGTTAFTSMTLGPDGNVWFGTGSDPEIAKITPSGTITWYGGSAWGALGSAGSGWIEAMTTGSDGNLWFTAWNLDRRETYLGRVTTSGTITLYDMGAHGQPGGLVFGPDGAIWFTTPTAIARATLPST